LLAFPPRPPYAAELNFMSVIESPVRPEEGGADSAPSRSRQETRRRLLEAGTALFAGRGLHGVTSAQIARRAGVATGTFYLHFRDKEALFREIVFAALRELFARQDRAALGQVPGSESELRVRTAELLAFAEDNRDLIRVVFGRGGESATLGEEVLDAILPGIEERLRRRAAEGRTPPGLHAGAAAQAHAAMLTRVLAWWVEDPSRASREEIIHTLLLLHPSRWPRREPRSAEEPQ
jgi:TetR/AcrR family fatty acid metabolism transcriptional regulator